MNMDITLGKGYKSEAQKIRVISESWAQDNLFCASCGGELGKSINNSRVLDFSCTNCLSQFELKSTRGNFSCRVPDGAYNAMMTRLNEVHSPDFFFLTYDKTSFSVTNLFVVPTSFLDTTVIEKRRPLSPNARRAGWIGCNIMMNQIPEIGKIFYVHNGNIINKTKVMNRWGKITFVRKRKSLESRGWTLQILRNIQSLNKKEFTLKEMYGFESQLKLQYPNNNFIQAKIRQQLQLLRDEGLIVFNGRGKYSINYDVDLK